MAPQVIRFDIECVADGFELKWGLISARIHPRLHLAESLPLARSLFHPIDDIGADSVFEDS
jgi:hypothetical protein